MNPLSRILSKRIVDTERIRSINRITMIDTGNGPRQYVLFFLFLAMSALIATCGIAAESSAVVIGAMLISPLMSPIIGLSFAITIGRPKKALKEFLIAILGTGLVVLVAALASQTIPAAVPLAENSEALSRVSPRLVDLISAIACGVVAALAVGRDDVFGTMPGVAISVSIVPPLCVAGTALAEGSWSLVTGSLLLFSVNFFAIQLACNFIFFVTGYAKHARDNAINRMRLVWYATALVGTLLLVVPLAAASNGVIEQYAMQKGATQAVETWLSDQPYDLISVEVSSNTVVVEVAGKNSVPNVSELKRLLRENDVSADSVKVRVIRQYV